MAIKLLLDTNSIIALLNEDAKVVELTDIADDIFISIINELEFKSFTNLSNLSHSLKHSYSLDSCGGDGRTNGRSHSGCP